MTSNDNYITIEMFNGGIQEIKSEMNQRFDKLENEIRYTNLRIDNMAERIDGVQSSINTGFTTVGIIIGLVGLIIAVFGVFKKEIRTERSEDLSSRNIRDIRALIREEFNFMRNAELRNN